MASVILAKSVASQVEEIPANKEARAVARRLVALQTFPEMGEIYDPDYEAARPDHEVRVTFAAHYSIYYTYDSKSDLVVVELVIDERRDPRMRF